VLISQRPTLAEEPINDTRSRFVIEPLEPGFGYTLGNSIRRTLLSSIPGAAVTSIRIDGVLERQFRRYYEEATRQKGKTGEVLLQLLERRLDNVVYRAGLARTRRQARQLVSHGHFIVNGRKVNIPSFQVSKFDIIDVKPKSMNALPFEVAKATFGDRPIPGWLQVIPNTLRILVHQVPERAQIDVPVQEQLIVEFYSK